MQRTLTQVTAPTWWLTASRNSTPKGSGPLKPPWALHAHDTQTRVEKTLIHTHKLIFQKRRERKGKGMDLATKISASYRKEAACSRLQFKQSQEFA